MLDKDCVFRIEVVTAQHRGSVIVHLLSTQVLGVILASARVGVVATCGAMGASPAKPHFAESPKTLFLFLADRQCIRRR